MTRVPREETRLHYNAAYKVACQLSDTDVWAREAVLQRLHHVRTTYFQRGNCEAENPKRTTIAGEHTERDWQIKKFTSAWAARKVKK